MWRIDWGDGFYAKMLGVSMLSMFENTKEKITVHVMHNDTLTPDNRGKFCYIAGQYNQRIEFHNVEEIASELLKKITEVHGSSERYTNAVWYNLLSYEVFPNYDKIISLGTDTVINLDIGELWAYDPGEHGFGAVQECLSKGNLDVLPICKDGYVKHEDYFNEDLLLIRPKFFLENFERILEGCRFIHEKNYKLFNQDVLNYLFSETYLKLPGKFNVMTYLRYRHHKFAISKEIYHFAGPKPDLNTDNTFNKLYMEYFLKTPYATAEMFGNLDKVFRRQYDRLKVEFLRYTNLLARRERVFLIDNKDNTEKMHKIFAIKNDELIVDASDPVAMKHFFETLNELKGKKLIYVFFNYYMPIRQKLLERNLVEGEDFADAKAFLMEKDGGRWLIYDPRVVARAM